jgi:hypothetical protein
VRGLWIKERGFYSMSKELKRVHLNSLKKALNNLKLLKHFSVYLNEIYIF